MTHTVLVYGTLRPGTGKLVKVPAKMYDCGAFPAIRLGNHETEKEGDSFIFAERVTVNDQELSAFDVYEGFFEKCPEKSLYIRVKHGDDWIYEFNRNIENLQIVDKGDWLKYRGQTQGSNAKLVPNQEKYQ